MKKTKFLLSLLFVLAINFSFAQVTLPHYEAFNYPAGDSLPMHGWIGVNGGDQILITDGSLSYTGLQASVGNKASFDGAGRDFQKVIITQNAGTVYMSAIFQITNLGSLNATGGYFCGFGNGTANFGSTIWLKLSGTGFNIGLNPKSTVANTVWDATLRNISTPIFVVVSYEFIAAANNDVVKMWINPDAGSFGGSTPPTYTLTATNGSGDLSQIDRFFLRQDAANSTPSIDIDEMRIGTTWAQVTPLAIGINELKENSMFSLYPNPSNGNFRILISDINSSNNMKVYNCLGDVVFAQDGVLSGCTIDLSKLDKGIYYVQVKNENTNSTATRKIVIQ
jgi:hypothetical protein